MSEKGAAPAQRLLFRPPAATERRACRRRTFLHSSHSPVCGAPPKPLKGFFPGTPKRLAELFGERRRRQKGKAFAPAANACEICLAPTRRSFAGFRPLARTCARNGFASGSRPDRSVVGIRRNPLEGPPRRSFAGSCPLARTCARNGFALGSRPDRPVVGIRRNPYKGSPRRGVAGFRPLARTCARNGFALSKRSFRAQVRPVRRCQNTPEG